MMMPSFQWWVAGCIHQIWQLSKLLYLLYDSYISYLHDEGGLDVFRLRIRSLESTSLLTTTYLLVLVMSDQLALISCLQQSLKPFNDMQPSYHVH